KEPLPQALIRTAGNEPRSPQRFFNLGQDYIPIALLADRSYETVGDRAVALDNKSFGHAIDPPVDRGSPLAVGADIREGIACLGGKARDICRLPLFRNARQTHGRARD